MEVSLHVYAYIILLVVLYSHQYKKPKANMKLILLTLALLCKSYFSVPLSHFFLGRKVLCFKKNPPPLAIRSS
jgi:hypothetical protein